MELEEMQAVWTDLSNQLESQKKLTDKMILMMTQEKYRNKINKIKYPEIGGAIICYIAVALILMNLSQFDNMLTLICAIIALSILIILPILSLSSIRNIGKINIAENSYKDSLLAYARKKKQFKKLQTVSYYISFILMLVILPVTSRIFGGKDLFSDSGNLQALLLFIPLGAIFLYYFSKRVMKHYNKNLDAMENLIQDLESIE